MDRVFKIQLSPDGNLLASCSQDKTCKIWEIPSGKLVHTLRGHTSQVFSIEFSPDGKFLASCGWDKAVKIWEISSGE